MSGAIACEADATMQRIDGGICGAIGSTLARYTPLSAGLSVLSAMPLRMG
jgi:hypothetical protein